MRHLIASAVPLALAACVTTMTPAARKIQRIDHPSAQRCENLGLVEGSSSLSGLSRNTGMTNAIHEMYEQALAAGATHIEYEPRRGTYWATGQQIQGTAYRCPPDGAAASASLAVPVGCTKDTDCKGDRVCVGGSCTDPLRR